MAAPDEAAVDSQNMLYAPVDGSFFTRYGRATNGDTVSAGTPVSGILESPTSGTSRPGYRVREMMPLESTSLSDGKEVYSALYSKDTNPSFPTLDTGFAATMYLRDEATGGTGPSANGNYCLLKEFGSTHYPTSGGTFNGVHNLRVVPMWYESGGHGGYTRGIDEFRRRPMIAGSRRMLDVGNWRYFPSLRGTPIRWNRKFNVSSSAGSETVRVFPTGPWSPLIMPTIVKNTNATGSGDNNWKDGDAFFYSVMFQFEDGSYSQPMYPRAISGTLTAGYGFCVVGTITGGTQYRDLLWSHVPVGPTGVVARILLRSDKVNLTATTTATSVVPGVLKVCGVLQNNTQVSYTDSLGDDTGLKQDDNIVRFDLNCPRRARHYWTGDQRVLSSTTLPSQCAIMVAPTGVTADYDQHDSSGICTGTDADGTSFGSVKFLVRITEATLSLIYVASGSTDDAGATITNSYTLASETLQSLVDKINATTVASNGKQWRAALAPNVDGSWAATVLCPNAWTSVSTTSAASTTLTMDAATLAKIPVGAKIYDPGGKITTGTSIVEKLSTTTCKLSAAASGAGSSNNIVIYCDTGDEPCVTTVAAGTKTKYGYMRAYDCWWPVVLYFKRTALANYDRPNRSDIYFTIASPGVALSGMSLAANAWGAGNRRQAPGYLGKCMGGVDVDGASVIAFSKGFSLFLNQRGVNTGEDFDYRLFTITAQRGCVSDDALLGVHGCAVAACKDGIFSVNKDRSMKRLSGAIHSPATGDGSLAAELKAASYGARNDTDDGHMHLTLLGSALHLTYRHNGVSSSYPTRRLVYDFSEGVDGSGEANLVDPRNGQPYGWSQPLTAAFSTACEVNRDSSVGLRVYGAMDDNSGGTADGHICSFDYSGDGYTDDGVALTANLYMATLPAPNWSLLGTQRAQVRHAAASVAPSLVVTRDVARGDSSTVALNTTSNPFLREVVEFPQNQRDNGEVFEAYYSTTGAARVWDVVVANDAAELLETV